MQSRGRWCRMGIKWARLLRSSWRGGERASRTADADALKQCASRLGALNGTTEGAFLAAGSKLGSILEHAREIARRSFDVSSTVSGAGLTDAAGDLTQILDELGRFETAAQQNEALLSETNRAARDVDRGLGGFESIVRTFHVLGTLTRIESVRLSSRWAEFQSLAEAVEGLAANIDERTGAMMEGSEELVARTGRELNKIAGIAAVEARDIGAQAERIRDGISEMEIKRAQAGELSSMLKTRHAEVSRRTGEVVTAIQFHDITRQKLEHVMAALEDLAGRTSAALKARAADLERGQLESARGAFLEAVARIEEELRAISAEVGEVSEMSKELLGGGAPGAESFFAGVESAFGGLSASIVRCSKSGRLLLDSTREVVEKCGAMNGFINEMESISGGIQLIALNTSIRTAHVGDSGAALGALAQSLRDVAREAMERCEQATGHVAALLERSRELERSADEQQTFQSAGISLVKRAEAAMRTLERAHEDTMGELSAIARANAELASEIDEAVSAFGIRERFSETTGDVARELANIAAEAARAASPEDDPAEALREFAQRYTMHSERMIHFGYAEREG